MAKTKTTHTSGDVFFLLFPPLLASYIYQTDCIILSFSQNRTIKRIHIKHIMKFTVATIFIGLIAVAAVDAHPPAAADANDKSVPATVVVATITTTTTTNDKQKKEDDAKPITEASAELSAAAAATTTATAKSDEVKTDEKLPVKIYYEGLCPDSRKLLSDLGREYYVFRKYITLDFVPFGRAKSLDADGNAFECHHGPKECVANRIHSCGIKYLTSQDAKQQFAVCQIRTEADQTGKEVGVGDAVTAYIILDLLKIQIHYAIKFKIQT